MYKVIIVDDEPSACRHIAMIIERYCEKFQVVDMADNGQDAIHKMLSENCDILITDVCMPIVNGIELIEWINRQGLTIKTIVTSGYQEFDYVQKAINLGACSYLLKPVVPNKLSAILQKLEIELEKKTILEQIKLFNALYYDDRYDEQFIRKVFPEDSYYVALKRKNGLPTRYIKNNLQETYAEKNKSITIYGRDVNEELFVIPIGLVSGTSLVDFIHNTSNLEVIKGYQTLVYFNEPIHSKDFFVRVKDLYQTLDSSIIVGVSQSITYDDAQSLIKNQHMEVHNDDLEMLYYYIKEKQFCKIKKELDILFQKWFQEKKSQLYLEAVSKQIIFKLRESLGNKISFLETEYLLEEVFTNSTTINELKDNYWEILMRYMETDSIADKIDTPQFLDNITEYLKANLNQQIALKEVCKKFGVSQPYLSKMFRKYINESYNQYNTRIRIEKASELMMQNSDILVKDVAAMVGYEDQFYFSRIFRSYMDVTPTEFIGRL
jgi:two-component system, response regulator YesN